MPSIFFFSATGEWLGKVTYLQIAPKNRSEIPDYIELEQAARRRSGPHQRQIR